MAGVRRVYAVKRDGYDTEAQALYRDLRENVGLDGLRGVRVFNRYDVAAKE